jgi:hypothetical protein
MISGAWYRLRRSLHRQRTVAVMTLSGMAVCEQRVVLERMLGPRVTKTNQRNVELGRKEHERQDADVRHYMTGAPIRRALLSGLLVGMPLTIAGEIVLHVADEAMTGLHVIGRILTAPGGIFREMAGVNLFDGTATLATYVILQWLYYALAAYALMALMRAAHR